MTSFILSQTNAIRQSTPSVQPTVQKKAQPEPTSPPEAEFEFSDVVKLTCLLCARQFKSLDQLGRHNKESDLHKVCGNFSPRLEIS